MHRSAWESIINDQEKLEKLPKFHKIKVERLAISVELNPNSQLTDLKELIVTI